jgi:hypothetical protein
MKKAALMILALILIGCQKNYPDIIRIEGGSLHVQGIALDQKNDCMYCSFTSAFFKTDLEGNVIGSVTGINGHLGAMTFDSNGRKAYASLEIKNDEIGRAIANSLGEEVHQKDQSGFFIAEIDVDKITGLEMQFEEIITLHKVEDAVEDYLACVTIDREEIEHRYGCSGIDGITIGPGFGSGKKRSDHLYVAYGVYGDTSRTDNDHNIIICYSLKDLSKPVGKYFIHTGNTRYGVQNMAYDKASRMLYLAVYKGNKPQYENYDLFAIDIDSVPYSAVLKDVPYDTESHLQLDVAKAWHFKWGSTGLCPLGDGRWYISENGKENGIQICNATLYLGTDDPENPFIKAE